VNVSADCCAGSLERSLSKLPRLLHAGGSSTKHLMRRNVLRRHLTADGSHMVPNGCTGMLSDCGQLITGAGLHRCRTYRTAAHRAAAGLKMPGGCTGMLPPLLLTGGLSH
jgi:hypothetical protein